MRSVHYLYLLIDREQNKKKVERIFIFAAFSLFLVHIILIWFARNTALYPSHTPGFIMTIKTPQINNSTRWEQQEGTPYPLGPYALT